MSLWSHAVSFFRPSTQLERKGQDICSALGEGSKGLNPGLKTIPVQPYLVLRHPTELWDQQINYDEISHLLIVIIPSMRVGLSYTANDRDV